MIATGSRRAPAPVERARGVLPRLVAALLFGGAAASPLLAQELPPGPGRDLVVRRCVVCHEADLIAQQRLTRAGWTRSLDKMIRWGATVDPEERDPMLDYLAAHFAAEPVSTSLVATAASEAIYKGSCLSCHEDDIIRSQRLSPEGWRRTVEKMIRWGARVAPEHRQPLIDYLAARYPTR